MKYPATTTLIVVTVLVALSTAALYAVTGYGTMLFQLVMLGAWGAVAKIASPAYADNHALPLVAATLVLNLVYFLVPAVPAWLALRKRWPRASSTVSALWCIFYVACLFILFPATDGREMAGPHLTIRSSGRRAIAFVFPNVAAGAACLKR